jgi:hypothetical protein
MRTFLFRLDLQMFAADGGGEFGAYDPSTVYEGIEDNFETGEEVQPEGQGEFDQFEEGEEVPVLDFGGRKLYANEDLMGLHKDYTEQQRYITALQDQVNAYKQLTEQTQMMQQAPQQPEPNGISSNVEDWNEETWQQFYDKPQDVIGSLVRNAIQEFASETIDPIIQEKQWNDEILFMYNSYPDFDKYVGDVQELINAYPDRYAESEGGLEQAYFRAKATKGSVDPAQLAQDPQFLQQYVMNNPQVQQQMVGQYFQQKQQTNSQIPTAMSRGAGGYTPQTPDAAPQTLKEASRAFLKNLGYR